MVLHRTAPAFAQGAARPIITSGVQLGDMVNDQLVVWSRADRPSRMWIEASKTEDFASIRSIPGPNVLPGSDFTGKRLLSLKYFPEHHFRVRFENLSQPGALSEPVLFTPPKSNPEQGVRFAWSGDVAGQGYGIDEARGGMKMFERMRQQRLDFFVHSGDAIYADGPMQPEVKLKDGTTWKNQMTDAKAKVADRLEDFWGNYRYNLLDDHLRAFAAEVPVFGQWDDHEVTNNWYPGEVLSEDDPHEEKSVSLLAARARQAFFDYMPVGPGAAAQQQIYRKISRGPLLDLFFLDLRSDRGSNPEHGPLMNQQQLSWFKRSLKASTGTWKVICSDLPIGLVVGDGKEFEAFSNGAATIGTREQQLAELLSFMKAHQIRNVIWLTADVHHASSMHYHPDRAVFKDFDPFWEFVSGPIHAGSFGPSKLDMTFGPERLFNSREGVPYSHAPNDQNQFFGLVEIAADSSLTLSHINRGGEVRWKRILEPV